VKTSRRKRGVALAGLVVAAIVGPCVWTLSDPDFGKSARGSRTAKPLARVVLARPPARSDRRVPQIGDDFIDDSGNALAFRYQAPIADRGSLKQCYEAAAGRAQRGIADLQAKLGEIENASPRPRDYDEQRARLQTFIGVLFMYDGRFSEASAWFERAMAENRGLHVELRANIGALRGVAALRSGEIENCVACLGPSSCIFPISPEAVHQRTAGSREAVRCFSEYLHDRPDDLGVRWLLNIAYMTLGEYPRAVPAHLLIAPDAYRSHLETGRFLNVALQVGLDTRGPNLLGGSVFDDFTGDDRPDVMVISGDWDKGGSLFVNRGDGRFDDRGVSAGLGDQMLSVNLAAADFDNDGNLDVLALRGGWETPYRLSLLRNKGGGSFDDVTLSAGLGEPIASQSAAWGDYDNDGLLDVYVAGEYDVRQVTSPLNYCRLYHNRGDGTFENVAEKAGVTNAGFTKGVAWGDYDNDGDLDLYVSNMLGPNRLYRSNGDGTFTDVAEELGVTEPADSFSCWFWDYDNDGRLDLFVTGFSATLSDIVSDMVGRPAKGERPRLYHNLGPRGFKDVAAEAGLDRVTVPMGSNFADIDNDGFLDVFLATGRPPYSMLIPDLMFKNVEGRMFVDITTASGTGHLQKGHGASFADWDDDGDLDLFVEVGGQTPGDKAHNVLFQNPGNDHHWIKLKLVGTKTNRAAIGAKLRAELKSSDGRTRAIYRTVGNNSSFGGNSLVQSIGLGDATNVNELTVFWPTSQTTQTFRDLTADRTIEITEGKANYRVVRRRPLSP
jgi:hypothetical protein